MKNKYKVVGGNVILLCPNPISPKNPVAQVTIDKKTFDLISNVDALWEVARNPVAEEDGQPFTIAAIINNQFVELKRIVVGAAKIPTSDEGVPTSLTAEEYINYLKVDEFPYFEDEEGFVYPLTHQLKQAKWDEGVLYINGNVQDNRDINLLKVKIKGLMPQMHLAHIDGELVYKRKR